ncbi:MAG: tryptophan-rich sensory protein [Clostridia bacterium]|nr:tryptophan-rich sensory protein [Clostridia bacterium]
MKEKIKSYAFFILSALAVGGLSAFFTRNNMDINNDVLMPPLSPPAILFPIVWTILFILMGISAGMIYNSTAPQKQKESALLTYALSLAVNFSWNIIFFNLRAFGFAFFWLLLLLFLIILTIVKYFKINKIAAYLQIPYALWVTFAGYLTAGIWWLNR